MAVLTKKPRRGRSRSKAGQNKVGAQLDIAGFRKHFGISQTLFARLLDISVRSASALESGSTSMGQTNRNYIQIHRLCFALEEVIDPPFIGQWFDTPIELLDGLKPVEAIERGKLDIVWQIAHGLRSGSFS